MHLDLIGLPPSLRELDAFLDDRSDDAYEKVVERLLASPRFGEHHARPWLDLARYADSNGFQADQLRDSWAYRDWVIDAINADMPFDRFTIEQIAGDMLPDASLSQKIATGFHRSVTCNVEAGVHPEANRVNQVVDRVNTTATVWLGTTLACAQCHEHKYDPFSQREYFELFAFFNNTPIEVKNPNGNSGVRFDFYGPKLDLPLDASQSQRLRTLRKELAELERQRTKADHGARARRVAWLSRARRAARSVARWQTLEVTSFASTGHEDHAVLDDASVLLSGRVPDTSSYTLRVRTKLRWHHGFSSRDPDARVAARRRARAGRRQAAQLRPERVRRGSRQQRQAKPRPTRLGERRLLAAPLARRPRNRRQPAPRLGDRRILLQGPPRCLSDS